MKLLQHKQSNRVDLRGFQYALEPLVKRDQWELDRLQTQLGQVQGRLQLAREQQQQTIESHQQQSQDLQRRALVRLDALYHQAGLTHLARLLSHIVNLENEIQTLSKQREQLQSQCLAQQLKLEGLRVHEAEVIKQYSLKQSQLHAAEADRDWIMRDALHRTLVASAPTVVTSGGNA